MPRSNMGAFRAFIQSNPSSPSWLNEVKVGFHQPGTFDKHATRYDWPMYRAIARLRTSESHRVAAPLEHHSRGRPVLLGAVVHQQVQT